MSMGLYPCLKVPQDMIWRATSVSGHNSSSKAARSELATCCSRNLAWSNSTSFIVLCIWTFTKQRWYNGVHPSFYYNCWCIIGFRWQSLVRNPTFSCAPMSSNRQRIISWSDLHHWILELWDIIFSTKQTTVPDMIGKTAKCCPRSWWFKGQNIVSKTEFLSCLKIKKHMQWAILQMCINSFIFMSNDRTLNQNMHMPILFFLGIKLNDT